jgi:hypothetical protein
MRLAFAFAVMFGLQQSTAPLTLRIRVFNGGEDVTNETQIKVFKAGEHQTPVAEARGRATVETSVEPGIYDAQVIREREGRALNIRWAERLIVMPYPDEGGRHLEVINFQTGYGALEIRSKDAGAPDVAIFAAGSRQQEAAKRFNGPNYTLFVVPAGRYDLRLTREGQTTWHPDIEVPVDRTRLWVAPSQAGVSDAAAGQQTQNDDDESDHEQDMNEGTCNVHREPQQPQNQQQYDKRPEHAPSFRPHVQVECHDR